MWVPSVERGRVRHWTELTPLYGWSGDNASQTLNSGMPPQAATIEIQTWCTLRCPDIEDALEQDRALLNPGHGREHGENEVAQAAGAPVHVAADHDAGAGVEQHEPLEAGGPSEVADQLGA